MVNTRETMSVSSIDKKLWYKMDYWLLYFVLPAIMCLLLLILIAWYKNNQ